MTKNLETGMGGIFDDTEYMHIVLLLVALGYFWVNRKAQL